MNPIEPMGMLQSAAGLFTLAALGGLVMAGIRFGGKHNPPAWLAMLHGLLAAAGITLLAYAALTRDVPSLAVIAVLLFLLAAGGRRRRGVESGLQIEAAAVAVMAGDRPCAAGGAGLHAAAVRGVRAGLTRRQRTPQSGFHLIWNSISSSSADFSCSTVNSARTGT